MESMLTPSFCFRLESVQPECETWNMLKHAMAWSHAFSTKPLTSINSGTWPWKGISHAIEIRLVILTCYNFHHTWFSSEPTASKTWFQDTGPCCLFIVRFFKSPSQVRLAWVRPIFGGFIMFQLIFPPKKNVDPWPSTKMTVASSSCSSRLAKRALHPWLQHVAKRPMPKGSVGPPGPWMVQPKSMEAWNQLNQDTNFPEKLSEARTKMIRKTKLLFYEVLKGFEVRKLMKTDGFHCISLNVGIPLWIQNVVCV